ncbi:MAG: histidine phosphatase family protein [Lachnospiraceae bacterium]|nr:histidine phosphatase family protein [Lachnospiraceae bacterium]
MAKKTVFMIRHGETPGNAEKRYIGCRTDEGLSAEGVARAARFYGAHPNLPGRSGTFRVCTSPMRRAAETAEILFPPDRREGSLIVRISDLREIDFGDFEGKTHGELLGSPAYQDWLNTGGTTPIPGAERREDFIDRSFRGFHEALGDARKEETIAVVCHGGNIMAVMSRLTGGEYYSFLTGNLGGYCLELEADDENLSVLSYHRIDGGDPA